MASAAAPLPSAASRSATSTLVPARRRARTRPRRCPTCGTRCRCSAGPSTTSPPDASTPRPPARSSTPSSNSWASPRSGGVLSKSASSRPANGLASTPSDTRMRTLLAFVALSFFFPLGAAAQQPTSAAGAQVLEVFREFDRIGAQPLWPGFEPTKTAVEVYDGTNTYLYHHPKPPEGFTPVAGAPGVFMFPGQHDSVRANTGTELNGVPTATADISKSKTTTREQAALLIHETFHVYEKKAHPKWAANEAELFTYPMDDPDLLFRRRDEEFWLRHAANPRNS